MQIGIAAVIFAAGTALGYVLASLPVRSRITMGGGLPADFLRVLGLGSLTMYACLFSSPLYLWLARRAPVRGRSWARNLALHVAVTVALVSLTGAAYLVWLRQSIPEARLPALGWFLLLRLLTESLPFAAMIALIHAFEFRRRHRVDEIRTAQLQTQLAEARLEALTAQLQPHFLFNTMQGISTLMHRDVKAADAMLSQLSGLLRETLKRGDRRESSLQEELRMLGHYIEISRERFKDRLIFEEEIAGDAHDALVPFFILQPLVENALQHGIARRAGAGRIRVSARRADGVLELSVVDDGPGLEREAASTPREGIGLSNTRLRLRELYGDAHSLKLTAVPGGGLHVQLTIPFRSAAVFAESAS